MWLHPLGGNTIAILLGRVLGTLSMKNPGGANDRYFRSYKIQVNISMWNPMHYLFNTYNNITLVTVT